MDHISSTKKKLTQAINAFAVCQHLTAGEIKFLKSSRRDWTNGIRRMQNHLKSGHIEKARRTEYAVLSSHKSKIACVLLALHAKGKILPYDELHKTAHLVNVFAPCPEPVQSWLHKKSNGGVRPISSFGIVKTARQYLVREILAAKIINNQNDFNAAGMGAIKLMKAIKLAMEDHFYWIECDIVSCFASLKPAHFETLPIRESIKANVLFDNGEQVAPKGTESENVEGDMVLAAQPGLPQGAATSQLLASAFLGRELGQIITPEHTVVFRYADNIIIGARHAADAEALAQNLEERLLSLSAGPLFTTRSELQDVRDHADIMGQRYRHNSFYPEGIVTVRPNPRSFGRFQTRLKEKLANWDDDYWARAHEYGHNWAASMGWILNAYTVDPFGSTIDLLCIEEDERRAAAVSG